MVRGALMRPLGVDERLQSVRPKDACRILQVSKSTLYRWERDGILPAERTAGGHRRYKLADLRKTLAAGGHRWSK